jgi:hypothetical protein
MKTKRKPGRPKKPRDQRADCQVKVNMTLAELAAIERAAGGEPVARWCRRVLLGAT